MKLDKLYSLIFVVAPGASRVIVFFILSHLYTNLQFADFSSLYSFAIIISMIGSAGYSILIIKNESQLSIIQLLILSIKSMIISLPFIFIFIFIFDKEVNWGLISVILLSLGIGLNQIFRNELILRKKFMIGCLYEGSLFIGIVSTIFIFDFNFIIISYVYILVGLIFKFILNEESSNFELISNKESAIIGYSNLISSGILFFFLSCQII